MSKTTMTSLIADLGLRGLVSHGEIDRDGSVGRPGTTVSLDGEDVCGVGLEINVDYIALVAIDLRGTLVREDVVAFDVAHRGVEHVLDRVAQLVEQALTDLETAQRTVVALSIAAPGVVELDTGVVRFAPNLGWRGVPLAAALTKRLGSRTPQLLFENDAKLAALAEYDQFKSRDVEDLLYLTGDVGVGAGIVASGQLLRGWSGFAGEVGHLPLDPAHRPCNCGRTGCWETMVGLAAFLRRAATDDDSVNDADRPLAERMATLRSRADAGDERTVSALRAIASDLVTGLSVLIDVLNPRAVVLGGYFAFFGEYLIGPVTAGLEARRMDAGSAALVTISRLGLLSAARGGAHLALEQVFDDPTVIPVRTPPGGSPSTRS